MKNKTYRFAVAAALLLALALVFAAPVGAEGTDTVIDTWNELKSALEAGGTVTLGGNINVPYDNETVTSGTNSGLKIKAGNVVNINAGTTVTLNLNGYSILATDPNNCEDSGWNYALFTVSGTLTITDSSSCNSGEITVESQYKNDAGNRATSVITVNPSGSVILSGGTLTHTKGSENKGTAGYVVDVRANGNGGDVSLTIYEGASLKSDYIAVRLFANTDTNKCSIIVNGGYITGKSRGIWIQLPGSNSDTKPTVDVTVDGGIIECNPGYD